MADDKSESAKSGLTDADLVLDDESVEDLEVTEEDSDVVRAGGSAGGTPGPRSNTLE